MLRKTLGVRDLALFYIATSFSIRWIATASAAGPSALVIWVMAALCLFVPLVFTVLELSSRYPDEGGIYVWSKRAFGPFAGFMTGWTYWGSNLPYLPGLLYFGAANALYIFPGGGPAWQSWSTSSTYFIAVAMGGLAITVAMNVVGLDVGKWLTNIGGVSLWIPTMGIIALGAISRNRFGAATAITPATLVPSLSVKDVVFWSTVAFAFAGVENASTMGDEIKNARRTLPRALLIAGAAITAMYIAATYFVLMALPKEQISGLQGIMQAIQVMTSRVGVSWMAPIFAAFVTISAIGGVSGWFAATARLPFVAGIDRYLPRSFGSLHPRWGTPHVALLVQAAIAAVFVVAGQAGTTVRGAYDLLVSMGIIGQFIPYLYMFSALIKVQREPAQAGVMRVPGGRPMAVVMGSLGFVVSAAAIVLACIPGDDEPHKLLAAGKIIGMSVALLVAGALIYAIGSRRKDR